MKAFVGFHQALCFVSSIFLAAFENLRHGMDLVCGLATVTEVAFDTSQSLKQLCHLNYVATRCTNIYHLARVQSVARSRPFKPSFSAIVRTVGS